MPRQLASFAIAALLVFPSVSLAQSDSAQLTPGLKKEFARHGVGVRTVFDAGEMTGFILEGPGQKYLTAYQVPGSDQLVIGTLLDDLGADLSEKHLYEYVHKENLAEVWETLESSELAWFAEGNPDAPYVYMFDDPMWLRYNTGINNTIK